VISESAKENPPKPTVKQLLGDAVSYARSNFKMFLLYGGGLVVVFKLIGVIQRQIGIYGTPLLYDLINWPIYFFGVFLKAIFAYNVHRFVLLRQRKISFALDQTFWLFFAAVLALQLAFAIPEELFGSFVTPERLSEWRQGQPPISSPMWFLLGPLASIVTSFIVLFLAAPFLAAPPSIVASGKFSIGASLAIGRALYWPIVWGLLLLNLVLSLYAFLVGLGDWRLITNFISMEEDRFTFVSMTLRTVLLAPVSFFSVLLGATFTAAAYIRGSKYLGLPDPTRN